MWPLTDITIYSSGSKILDAPKDWTFRRRANFISDYYHHLLEGYKPPRTARICILLNFELGNAGLVRDGALCSFNTTMNEDEYLKQSQVGQYRVLLDLVHSSCVEAGSIEGWNLEIFTTAYKKILDSGFAFRQEYPRKKSRDRKNTAMAILEKNEEKARVLLEIQTPTKLHQQQIIEKRNWFWFDSTYEIARECKWIDNDSFGWKAKGAKNHSYYSVSSETVKSNLEFTDSEF